MKIYKISQDVNNEHDTYDSAIVVAESEEQARKIHPSGYKWKELIGWVFRDTDTTSVGLSTWCPPAFVKVEYIGTANDSIKESKVILASYNAG